MPFKSKRQQRFMYATKPKGVDLKEWAEKTDFSKLPEKVRKKKKKDKNDVFQGEESLEAHGKKTALFAEIYHKAVKASEDEEEEVTIELVTRGDASEAIKDLIKYIKDHEDEEIRFYCGNGDNFIAAVSSHLRIKSIDIKKDTGNDENYPENTVTIVADGDWSYDGLLRILKFLKYIGGAGASRGIRAKENKELVDVFGFDGDGADSIKSIKVNGKDIDIQDGDGFGGLT